MDTEPETGNAKSQAGTEQTLTEKPEETKPENESEMPQEALTETQEASEQTQEVSEQTQVHTPQAVSVTVSATGDCTLEIIRNKVIVEALIITMTHMVRIIFLTE